MTTSKDNLLTLAQVSERTGWSDRTIRRAVSEGRLAVIRFHRSIRVSEPALADFLNGNTYPATQAKPGRKRAK